jgi:hypothetical protein
MRLRAGMEEYFTMAVAGVPLFLPLFALKVRIFDVVGSVAEADPPARSRFAV